MNKPAYVIFPLLVNLAEGRDAFKAHVEALTDRGEWKGGLAPVHISWPSEAPKRLSPMFWGFLVWREDYEEHVKGTSWTNPENDHLTASSCNKMYATAVFGGDAPVGLGSFHQLTWDELSEDDDADGFVYRLDLGLYWGIKKGNPDHKAVNHTEPRQLQAAE